MAKPLRVSFVSDVSAFLKGTKDIEGALDDVSGSLDDVSREAADSGQRAGSEFADGIESGMRDVDADARRLGQDAGDSFGDGLSSGDPGRELADSVDDSMRDVESDVERAGQDAGDAFGDGLTQGDPGTELRESVEGDVESLRQSIGSEADRAAADVESATERMEQSFKGTFDDVPRNAKTNLTQMSQSVDDGATRAKASMGEVKQEATQNAAETFSSFDGSAKSLVDGVQGTFGGIVSALGPLGAAIGAAGAVGIGAITSHMEKAKEEAQDLRDRIGDLTGRLNELRTGGATAVEQVADELVEMAEASEEGEVTLSGLNDALKMIGLEGDSLEQVSQALAGDPEKLDEVTEKVRERVEAMREQNVEGFEEGLVHDLRIANGEELLSQLETEQEAQQAARDNEQLLIEAGIEDLERETAAKEAADERRVASAERVHERFTENAERLAETNQGMADSITSAYDQVTEDLAEAAEDGELSIEELETSLAEAAERQKASTERWAWAAENLSQNQINALIDMGEEGEQALETIMNSPPEASEETKRLLEEQGRVKGQAERDGVIDGAGGPIIIPVEPEVDQRAYDAARRQLGQSIHMRIIPGIDQAV